MENMRAMEGGERPQAQSAYQAAGYRMAIGPLALRAVEDLVQRKGIRDGDADGLTEDSLEAATGELTPTEAREDSAKGRQVLANVYSDPKRHTVSLLLDEATANTVIYAVRLFAAESEAHAREVRMVGATLPPDSYGAANRHVIASRHERVAARLRVLESNYRAVAREG